MCRMLLRSVEVFNKRSHRGFILQAVTPVTIASRTPNRDKRLAVLPAIEGFDE